MRMKSRHEKPLPRMLITGWVSDTMMAMVPSRARRMISASEMPMRRGLLALALGQLVGEDGDEDEVVDAKDDLHGDQGRERGPGGRGRLPAGRCLPRGTLSVTEAYLPHAAHQSGKTPLCRTRFTAAIGLSPR